MGYSALQKNLAGAIAFPQISGDSATCGRTIPARLRRALPNETKKGNVDKNSW